MNLIDIMEESPIIASVINNKSLKQAIVSDCKIVFVLYGTILSISDIINELKAADKYVIVNIDLINGIAGNNSVVVDYVKNKTKADGIMSTKPNLVREAKQKGLFSILRFFVFDSKSFYSLEKQFKLSQADVIDILPGLIPRVIEWALMGEYCPVIASGLVCEKTDVISALGAGATAISTTNIDMWKEI